MELKFIVFLVVCEHFDIVVKDVPRHVNWVKARAPAMEGRRPEVHPQALRLIEVLDGRILRVDMSNLVAINNPSNIVRRPLHFIGVPVVMWVELVPIVMRLNLIVPVAIYNIHGEGILFDRWHDLEIQLIPLKRIEVGPVPVCEEARHGALAIGRLHASHKLAVPELLVSGYRATSEVGLASRDGD